MSDDEDEDYMSESFLKSLEKQDVRPGLCIGGAKRELEIHKKHKANAPVSVAAAEEIARSKGLDTALDEKNKGFRLLQKSISKQNTGIFDGSDTAKRKPAITTPIPVIIKKNRSGLREGDSRPIASDCSIVRDELTSEKLTKFRENQQESTNIRQLIHDIKTSQKACYNLDSDAGITEPEPEFLWPFRVIEAMKQKLDDDEPDMSQSDIDHDCEDELRRKLDQITERLRKKYFFCIWCGIRFETESELALECPGNSRLLHD